MTQPENHDERLLDYLYEEMSPEEAQAFSVHVAGCEQCRRELQQFRGVRTAFHREPVAVPEQALQRMTETLLSAARDRGQAGGPTPLAPETSSASDPPEGKVLPFRRRGVMRVLLHPASGIMAAAAAALVLVVTRGVQYKIPAHYQEPSSPQLALEPAETKPAEAKPAPAQQPLPETAETETAADKKIAAKGKADLAEPVYRATKAPAAHKKVASFDDVGSGYGLVKSSGGGLGRLSSPSAKPSPVPMKALTRDNVDSLDSLLAQGAAPSKQVRREEAPAEKPKDEERQVVAAAPPPPQAAPQQAAQPVDRNVQYAPPPATPTPQRWAPGGAPAASQAAEVAEGKEDLYARTKNAQQNDFNNLMSRRGAVAGPDGGPQQLVIGLREQLKKGNCKDAADTLAQLSQRFPGYELKAEDQALYHQSCAPAQPAQQNEAPAADQARTVQKAPAPAPRAAKAKKAAAKK